jgi:hypothetical protein
VLYQKAKAMVAKGTTVAEAMARMSSTDSGAVNETAGMLGPESEVVSRV